VLIGDWFDCEIVDSERLSRRLCAIVRQAPQYFRDDSTAQYTVWHHRFLQPRIHAVKNPEKQTATPRKSCAHPGGRASRISLKVAPSARWRNSCECCALRTREEPTMERRNLLVAFSLLSLSPNARADDAAAGKPLYAQHCVVCHGVHGKGNGPSGKKLDPKPTDFTTAVPNDEEWFKATKLGTKAIGKSNNMEAYGAKLTDQQIRDVLAYVKTFKQP
jgi:mono/diheme cytochrome c family protein